MQAGTMYLVEPTGTLCGPGGTLALATLGTSTPAAKTVATMEENAMIRELVTATS